MNKGNEQSEVEHIERGKNVGQQGVKRTDGHAAKGVTETSLGDTW